MGLSEYPKPYHIEQEFNNRIQMIKQEFISSLIIIAKQHADPQVIQELNQKYSAILEDLEIQKRQEMIKYTFIGKTGLVNISLITTFRI